MPNIRKSRKKPRGVRPPASNKGRHIARYPWDEWFGNQRPGRKFTLTRGIDFACQVHGMVSNLRKISGSPRYRLKLLLRVAGDTIEATVTGKLPPRISPTP